MGSDIASRLVRVWPSETAPVCVLEPDRDAAVTLLALRKCWISVTNTRTPNMREVLVPD